MNFIGDITKLKKDAIGYQIYDILNLLVEDQDACLYYNHPFYRGDIEADLISAKLFLVSSTCGLLLFNYSAGIESPINMSEYIDTLYAEISGRMLKRPELRESRRLKYDIVPIIIDSRSQKGGASDDSIVCNIENLPDIVRGIKNDLSIIPPESLNLILSCIDGTATLKIKRDRTLDPNKHMANILNDIQNHIASFDVEQRKIADVIFDGPQRIRGLAGSGKTIVLAYKAAAYHARFPEKKILYTYYTKSLGDTVKNLIRRAFKTYSSGEPNWDNVIVCHGWGSEWTPGVYWLACKDNGVTPLTLSDASGKREDPFSYACKSLLENNLKQKYDLILIDEGQDFRAPFYQLCYSLSLTKQISWAYDDFQNIFDVNIQDEIKTFGYNSTGRPNVEFDAGNNLQDVTLKKCYRTPRYTLIYAFALGLGIYNNRVLQRLSSNEQWESLGFLVEHGDCLTGERMVISRPLENTPSYSNEVFDQSCVTVLKANDVPSECREVAEGILKCINEGGLLPEDICVICIDQKSISNYLSGIEMKLRHAGINVFNHLNAPYSSTKFFSENSVTLTSVNRAKGNECGAVFVCGADVVFNDKDNVVLRDKLFTAMTRTKGWLWISGIGDSMEFLENEIEQLKANNFRLVFTQPDEAVTKTIENVSRATLKAEDLIVSQINALKGLGLDEQQIKTILDNLVRKT